MIWDYEGEAEVLQAVQCLEFKVVVNEVLYDVFYF